MTWHVVQMVSDPLPHNSKLKLWFKNWLRIVSMEDDVKVKGLTLVRCDEWDEVDPSPLKTYYFKPWSMAHYSIT